MKVLSRHRSQPNRPKSKAQLPNILPRKLKMLFKRLSKKSRLKLNLQMKQLTMLKTSPKKLKKKLKISSMTWTRMPISRMWCKMTSSRSATDSSRFQIMLSPLTKRSLSLKSMRFTFEADDRDWPYEPLSKRTIDYKSLCSFQSHKSYQRQLMEWNRNN